MSFWWPRRPRNTKPLATSKPTDEPMTTLNPRERRIVAALAQTIFPPDRSGITDAIDAGVVDYLDRWIGEVEPFERLQLRAMFQLFEFSIAVETLRPMLRFSNATPEERETHLRSWMESSIYARRMAFNALRSAISIAYLASPKVAEEIKLTIDETHTDPLPHLRELAGLARELRKGQNKSGKKIEKYEPQPWTPGKEAPRAQEAFTAFGQPQADRPKGAHVHPKGGVYLPKQHGLFEFDDYTDDITEQCDVVIVGSGPGGALAARWLAEQGKDVIVVEAGPVVRREEFVREGGYTLSHYYWDSGLRTTRGNVIMPTMQPRVLGGGSVLNSAICMRMPDYALTRWQEEHGVDISHEELARHFDVAEKFMGVKPVDDDVQGVRNILFKEAGDKLNIPVETITRNEYGCKGSGFCNNGCPNGAKLSTDLRGIPETIYDGGRVYTSVNVDRLLTTGNRVRGIEGTMRHPQTGEVRGTLRVFAKCTILAAGAIASPVIIQKSGLANPTIGANLRMHPATVVAGVFRDDVLPWTGATQGYHSTHFMQEGIKLESLWADAALMSFRVPGMGSKFKKHISDYRKIATWDAWVSGDSSVGSVRWIPGLPRPNITYNLGQGDVRRLQAATITLSEMFFAVGAKYVYPGIDGLPERIRKVEDLDRFRNADVKPTDLPAGSNHVYGGMSMGADPDKYATDSYGKVHGIDDLYICDTGLYPGTPSANPMFTVMALAHRLAETLNDRY